jgi:hypothetical protein
MKPLSMLIVPRCLAPALLTVDLGKSWRGQRSRLSYKVNMKTGPIKVMTKTGLTHD